MLAPFEPSECYMLADLNKEFEKVNAMVMEQESVKVDQSQRRLAFVMLHLVPCVASLALKNKIE